MPEGVVGRSEAVVSPADGGTNVPAVAGMKFSAVAEVYSSTVDDEGAPLVIRDSRQRRAVVGAGPVRPGGKCGGLVDGMTVSEPIEHLVVGVPNEGGNMWIL